MVALKKPVVDFHIHPANYEIYSPSAIKWICQQQGMDEDELLDNYSKPQAMVEYLKQNGVDYAVIMAELSPAITGSCSNENVAKFCEGREFLFPFASINPYLHNRPGDELEYWVKERGFKGVKLYPTYQFFYPNDSMLYPFYAKAEELGIPVMLHTGSSVFKGARIKYGDPTFLDDVAVDFPKLNIIMAHSGRGFWYDRAFFLARLHENVYMELAGLPPSRLLTYFPELERNADKIIFGSDWPGLTSIAENIEAIRRLPISEEAKDKILGKNAARVLKII
ncbi:MAG: amidohydrolase family protein [Clostridia bacterium]|nr:amidohydrolase family protein [Clostridia bacterium]